MDSSPTLGIIIPSYNDLRIVRAIASVRASDPGNITRMYVIDGASNERTLSAVREILRPADVLISEKDRGIFDALNKGLDCVREEYFGWIGTDDFFVNDIDFFGIVSRFEERAVDCVLFDTVFIDDFELRRRSFARRPSQLNYCTGRLFPHFSSFWKRNAIGDLRFSLEYKIAADIDFFLRLVSSRNLTSVVENKVATIMRIGGVSTAGFRQVFTSNFESYLIYRKQLGSLLAAFAVFAKLATKFIWALTSSRYPIIKEILEAPAPNLRT